MRQIPLGAAKGLAVVLRVSAEKGKRFGPRSVGEGFVSAFGAIAHGIALLGQADKIGACA